MTVYDLYTQGVKTLRDAGFDVREAENSAAALLEYVLSYTSTERICQAQIIVSDAHRSEYISLIKRRATHEPVQYIIGHVAFMNCTLTVARHCLIPRPETELLVERAIAWIQQRNAPTTILDIGTGSGNIAISIAQACPHAHITAVDINLQTLLLAQQNAHRNAVAGQIDFIESALFSALSPNTKYDLIVSNPPYLSISDLKAAQQELTWEPHHALVAGTDGIEIIRDIIATAQKYINNTAALFIEIGCTQGSQVTTLFTKHGYTNIRIIPDYAGHDRIAYAECL